LRLPVSVVGLAGLVLAWVLPLILLLVPAFVRRDPDGAVTRVRFGPLTVGSVDAAWGAFACGIAILLVVTPMVTRQLLALDAGLAGALLGHSAADLRTRVRALETSRAGVVDAGDRERRRLERDLHDGAQQRLVALAMVLGRAQRRLGDDSDPVVRSLLAEARTNAGEAITELRELARGLHPPVLTDHGLDAALAAVAARLPVPVAVDITALPRPRATIEAVAYFVACEALTNIAKHANATRAAVHIVRTGDTLCLEVRDDGVGGADPTLGSGLKGIAERVAGVDGTVSLDSPDGGPTTLRVVLPCAS
jgi:signal transduction histidine kinase